MNQQIERILARLRESPEFAASDLSDVNACSTDGDNALHFVIRWGDLSGAKALIDAGIDVNKAGDLGYTPLHVACMQGNMELVKLLADNGADLFALSEGEPPFATARIAGQDQLCELLAPLMQQAQSQHPKIWLRARIAQLRREIASLEAKLDTP
jgi:ankyrin repeat protein